MTSLYCVFGGILQEMLCYQWSWLVQVPGNWVQSTPSPVQWLSPTELVTALSPSSGRDHPTRQLSLNPLSLADSRDYTCTASYDEGTPKKSGTETVTPISKSPPFLTSLYRYL